MLNQTPPDDSRFYVQPFVPSITQQFSEEIGSTGFPTLTKRELFAAMALQGILSSDYHGNQAHINNLTDYAVAYADSLIAQLGGEAK